LIPQGEGEMIGRASRNFGLGHADNGQTTMALSLVNADPSGCPARLDWPAVQLTQFQHDEKYHPEISRLPMQARLRHMTLHFAKYAGRLLDDPSDLEFKRLTTDALIIGLSSANTLNIDLSEAGVSVAPMLRPDFAKRLAIYAGHMSSACERLDHLEDFPFRKTLAEGVLRIIASCLGVFEAEGWAPVDEMRDRLAPIKAKKLFHGQL
jgi:hypothetical protein